MCSQMPSLQSCRPEAGGRLQPRVAHERCEVRHPPSVREGGRAYAHCAPRRGSSWRGLLSATVLACCACSLPRRAWGAALKVGTCRNGSPPYVQIKKGQNEPERGFDGKSIRGSMEYDLWQLLYKEVKLTIGAGIGDPAAKQYIDTTPYLQVFESREQVQAALRKQEIDVGFCGLPISDPTDVGFDFLPSHLDTGLSFVVKDYTSAELAKVGYDTVLNEILGPFQDPQAVVALLILFAFAIIFAHIFYAIELGSDDVFKDDYGPGIVDAFWFAIVTALTVGYGDKVPSSILGKMVAIIWMMMGTYLLSLFVAALTSAVVLKALTPAEEVSIENIQDIVLFSTAALHSSVFRALLEHAPGVKMKRSANVEELLEGVNSKDIQVGVIDTRTAKFFTAQGGSMNGILKITGPTFSHQFVGIGVSRPNGQKHPIMVAMVKAMVRLLEPANENDLASAEFHNLAAKHLGEANLDLDTTVNSLLYIETVGENEMQAKITAELTKSNVYATIALGVFVGIWTIAQLYHFREEILEDRARQQFVKKLGLQRRFTVHQLRLAARQLFDQFDSDKSGSMTYSEIIGILKKIGKQVTFEDISPYIKQQIDEREEEEEARKREEEAQSLLEEEMAEMEETCSCSGNRGTADEAAATPGNGVDNAGTLEENGAKRGSVSEPPDSPSKRLRQAFRKVTLIQRFVGSFKAIASDIIDDIVDSEPDYESVTLTREEFVCVIEGFVMDHEEESDDADDYRAPAQRRHLHTIAGDVQEQVHKFQLVMQEDVDGIRTQIAAVNRRIDVIMNVLTE